MFNFLLTFCTEYGILKLKDFYVGKEKVLTMMTNEEQLVDVSLDIGKAMLLAGGEVTRVEDTISRLLHAYGMRGVGASQ